MDSTIVIVLLYFVGLSLLIAEVFVPSHGLLTVSAIVCLGVAVWQTFERTTTGGAVGLTACLILIPTVLLLGIKNVHRLPMANFLAPPNPEIHEAEQAARVAGLHALVGKAGRAVTPLHPVGFCDFDGKRVPCVAEAGIIDINQRVVGIEVRMSNLAVRAQSDIKTA
jgi:membrane-bound serine protease (ClpP class)